MMSCGSTALPFLFLLFLRVQNIDLTQEFEPPEIDGSAVDICSIFFVTTPAPFTTTTTTTKKTTTTTPTTTTTKKTTTTTPTTTTTTTTTTPTTTTTTTTTTPTTTTTKKTTTTTPATTTTTKPTTTTSTTKKQVVPTTEKPAVPSSPRKPETKNTRTPIRPKPAPARPVTVSRSNAAAGLLHYLLNRAQAAHWPPRFNNIFSQPMGWLPQRGYAMSSDSDESAARPLKRARWTDKNRWKIGSFSSEDSSDES